MVDSMLTGVLFVMVFLLGIAMGTSVNRLIPKETIAIATKLCENNSGIASMSTNSVFCENGAQFDLNRKKSQ